MDKRLLIVLALAILLLLLFYSGLYKSFDDQFYYNFSLEVVNHTFNPAANPYSYGWLFPYFVALGGLAFGFTSYGLVVFTALEYLSLIILTYILALRLTEKKELAIASALIVVITPFVLQYSTRLLNDTLLGVMATLSIIFFLSKRKIDWYLSGIMASLLIYIKLIGLAYLIFFGLAALLSDKRKYVIPMMALMLVIYTIPFLIFVHNPLYPFQNYGAYQNMISNTNIYDNVVSFFQVLGLIKIQSVLLLIDYQVYSVGSFIALALMGTLLSIVNKKKNMVYISFLFWGFFFYIYFGTISLSTYTLGSTIPRYFTLVAAPFAILIAYAFYCTYDIVKNLSGAIKPLKKQSRNIALVAVILIFAIMILTIAPTYRLIYIYNKSIRTGTPLPLNQSVNASSKI